MELSEDRIQQEIFTSHWNDYPEERKLLFMVHNNPKNKIDGARLKSKGLVSGVSDLVYLSPREVKSYYLEVKTESGNQSESQKEWEKLITSLGYSYHIIRSYDEFKEVVGLKEIKSIRV